MPWKSSFPQRQALDIQRNKLAAASHGVVGDAQQGPLPIGAYTLPCCLQELLYLSPAERPGLSLARRT